MFFRVYGSPCFRIKKNFSPRSRQPVSRRKDISEFLRIKNVQLCSAWKENAGNLRIKRKHRSERGGSSLVMRLARGSVGKVFSGKVSIVPQWAKSEYAILGFRTHKTHPPEPKWIPRAGSQRLSRKDAMRVSRLWVVRKVQEPSI